jgi:hypothetical protein
MKTPMMFRIPQIILFLLLATLASGSLHGSVVTGLVAHYPLDGNADDAHTGAAGTEVNSPTYVPAVIDLGMHLNGSNQRATGPMPAALAGSGPKSVSIWFNQTAAANKGLITFGTNANPAGRLFEILLYNGTVIGHFRGTGFDTIAGAPAYSVGKWHHVVLTYDGTTVRVYVDGQFGNQRNMALNTVGTLLQLGSGSGTYAHFNGTLDDAALWGRALTLSEIQAIYIAGLSARNVTEAAVAPVMTAITAPARGAGIPTGSTLAIEAVALAAEGAAIEKVEFFANGEKIGEATSSPHVFEWEAVPAGAIELTAVATDNFGQTGAAAPVSIFSSPVPTSITSPASGSTVTTGSTLVIEATAVAAPGAEIEKVEFFANGGKIGEASSSPYAFEWYGVPGGAIELTVQATDSEGKVGISAPVNVYATPVATVEVQTPAGTTFNYGDAIELVATVEDPDGVVARVEFFRGTTLIGEATSAPYTLTWSSPPTGHFSVTAKATDQSDYSAVSPAVVFKVLPPDGLVGHYRFDGDVDDSSTSANHAALVGEPEFVQGMFGNALSLNGVDQYATAPYAPLLTGPGPKSMSIWFKHESAANKAPLSFGVAGNPGGRLFEVLLYNSTLVGHFSGTGFDTLSGASAPAPTYALGEWNHAVITYDGTTARVYLNGQFGNEKDFALSTDPSILRLGTGATGAYSFFNGMIDDVGLWNRTLSASEVAAIYQGGLEGKDLSQVEFGPVLATFDGWRALHFSGADLDNPEVSGPQADPTGSGLPNLLRYAMGLGPLEPVEASRPAFSLDEGGQLLLEYDLDLTAGGISVAVEGSNDLVDWDAAGIDVAEVSRNGGIARMRATDTVTLEPRRFLRLRVQE